MPFDVVQLGDDRSLATIEKVRLHLSTSNLSNFVWSLSGESMDEFASILEVDQVVDWVLLQLLVLLLPGRVRVHWRTVTDVAHDVVTRRG